MHRIRPLVASLLDTRMLPHAELVSRTVGGYDFILSTSVSNDGDGRDANASDPGDYGCNGEASSWHGTHVAGALVAASNNGVGVAGINRVSKIVPIRVLGKCDEVAVRFGTGLSWVTQNVTGSCNYTFFGSDPAYGTTKECDLLSQ